MSVGGVDALDRLLWSTDDADDTEGVSAIGTLWSGLAILAAF